MADPLTLGALGLWGLSTTTSAVLGGTSDRSCLAIVGQIKDRFAGWRGLPANHHVARAVQLAHAQALERVLNVAKADDKGGWSEFPSAERAFYDEMIGEARALHRFADTAKPGDLIYDLGTDLTAAINAVLARPGHDGPATERATTLRAAAQSNALAVIRATIRQRQLSEPPHFEASFVDAQPGRGYISAFGGYIARQIKTNAAFRDIFVVEGLARIEALGFDAVSILAAFEEKLGKGLDEIFEQFKSAQADRDRKHEALLAAIASARGVPSENLRPLFAAVGREVPEADFAGAIEAAVVELIARAERRPDAFNDGEDIRQAIEIARQSLRQLDPNGAIESLRAAQREQAEHRRVHAHGEARLAIEEAEILKVVYRWDEAIAAFERAACLSSDEAWPFFEIGDIWIIRGRIANAASYYERARHVAERANNERDLSVSHDKIGDVLVAEGRLEAAGEAYRSGLVICERLAREDPTNAGLQRDLSVSHNRIGDVLVAEGRLEAAGEAYRSGLVIRERLAREDPTNAGLQRDLSVSHDKIGDVLVAEGRLEAAGEAYRSGLVICERLAREDPTNAGLQRDLIVSHVKLAGLGIDSIEHYRTALAIAQTMRTSGRLAPRDQWVIADLEKRLREAQERGA